MTKYDSPRDELLHKLTLEGWSEHETGDVEAPSGFVSRLNIKADDLGSAYLQKTENIEGIKREDLLGNWILTENSDGFVHVQKYDTPEAAIAVIEVAEDTYSEWLGEGK